MSDFFILFQFFFINLILDSSSFYKLDISMPNLIRCQVYLFIFYGMFYRLSTSHCITLGGTYHLTGAGFRCWQGCPSIVKLPIKISANSFIHLSFLESVILFGGTK